MKKILVGYKNESSVVSNYCSKNFDVEETDALDFAGLVKTYFKKRSVIAIPIGSEEQNFMLICNVNEGITTRCRFRLFDGSTKGTPIYGTVLVAKFSDADFTPETKLLSLTAKEQQIVKKLLDMLSTVEDEEEDLLDEFVGADIDVLAEEYAKIHSDSNNDEELDEHIEQQIQKLKDEGITLNEALNFYEEALIKLLIVTDFRNPIELLEEHNGPNDVMVYSNLIMNLFEDKFGFPSSQVFFAHQAIHSLNSIIIFAFFNKDTPLKKDAEMIRKHYRSLLNGIFTS